MIHTYMNKMAFPIISLPWAKFVQPVYLVKQWLYVDLAMTTYVSNKKAFGLPKKILYPYKSEKAKP